MEHRPHHERVLITAFAIGIILGASFFLPACRGEKKSQPSSQPVIMTSLAFALGVLPLAIAMGAGANARHSIGTGIIGGMIGETTLAMLYVPLLFYLFDRLSQRSEMKNSVSGGMNLAGEKTGEDTAHENVKDG